MSAPVFHAVGQGVYCIDALYTAPGVASLYLVDGGGEYALIETGTARSLPNILATLDVLDIPSGALRYIIPTHVHLDHAGGAGALMNRFPAATLLAHPRGARHLIDPSRLVASARQVYGDELFESLYGEIMPVAAERVTLLEDGCDVQIGSRSLRVRHTRGHAEHHLCLFDAVTRGWFSGDMFGVSYPSQRFAEGAFVMPATTPTQFDPSLYAASVRALAAEQPAVMYLTHFGALPFAAKQADALCRQLQAYATLADRVGADTEHLEDGIRAIATDELARLLPAADAARAAADLAMDVKLNAQGVAWWRQHRH